MSNRKIHGPFRASAVWQACISLGTAGIIVFGAACADTGSDPDPTGGKADDAEAQGDEVLVELDRTFISGGRYGVVFRIDEYAAGNGEGHGLFVYDTEAFDIDRAVELVPETGCFGSVTIVDDPQAMLDSFDTADERFEPFIDAASSLGQDGDRDRADVRELFQSDRLLAGVARVMPENELNSEACAIYRYDLYFDDGIGVSLDFNFTD